MRTYARVLTNLLRQRANICWLLCEDMLVIFQTNASAMFSVIIQLANLGLWSALVNWRTFMFGAFTNKRVSVLWQIENEEMLVNFDNIFLWV